jgi:predicted KAP-like P-loop ATPase
MDYTAAGMGDVEGRADAPKERLEEDAFGRGPLVRLVKAEALASRGRRGFVIAVCGPWGSGKSSIANFVREQIGEETTVFTFNPWLFSGTHDLVERFFAELARELASDKHENWALARKAGADAGALSGLARLVPGVGGPLAAILSGVGQLAAVDAGPSLVERRDELAAELQKLRRPIVVILDDLDRLVDEEIREIVRLVKLVGDLPNLSYVLLFDRGRVEDALGAPETNEALRRERGRGYLEKIVQSRHDLPPTRAAARDHHIKKELGRALAEAAPSDLKLSEREWEQLLAGGLRDLVVTPRDVVRLAIALPAAVELHRDELALRDLVVLEALRVFEPDVHASLLSLRDVLIPPWHAEIGDVEARKQRDRDRANKVLASTRRPEAVRRLLGELFPAGAPALGIAESRRGGDVKDERQRRVAVPSVFANYVHAALDAGVLPTREITRLVAQLDDLESLRSELRALSANELNDFVDRLPYFVQEVTDHVGVIRLLIDEAEPVRPFDGAWHKGRGPPTSAR